MNPVLQQALERLAEVPADPGNPPTLLLWELRATLRGETGGAAPSVASDGGWRAEWGSERGRGWRFAVGAGPRASILSGRRTPGRRLLDPQGWDAAVAAMEEALRLEFRSRMPAADALAAARDRGSGPPGRVAVEIHVRWRAWRRGAAAPRHAEERGFHLTPQDSGEGVSPAWGLDGAVPPKSWSGPLVLLAPAAGWWVHEMGHAALESAPRIGPAPASHGLAIVDDPASGPWPAGFAVDDAGDRARAATLWDGSGPHAPARRGRRRRPSVRDTAEAALSITRLAGKAARVIEWSDLPEGTPVAAGVRAGRFDPSTGLIALELERVGEVRDGACRPVCGHAVALVPAAAGWRGLCTLPAGPWQDEAIPATCSRLGAKVPVMVGAPTIVLDPVQVIP
jgi:hypothetical protein